MNYNRRGRGFPRNNNGNRSFTPGAANSKFNQLEARITQLTKGKVFRPSVMPPVFSTQPWNSAIVRSMASLTTAFSTIDASNVISAACNQLGLFTGTGVQISYVKMEFKVVSVACWFKLDNGYFRLLPLDLIESRAVPTQTRELTNIDCMAQKNMYATGGYVWPSSHQQLVFTNGDKGNILALEGSATGNLEWHLKIN
ncbi:unnamed protein product [Psylliodes chrysocephalus]|uniref:Uncharacterized protein n=1 Tax=Psylliodes chrysocephalus TaxID=3402493 RepID=A0A9P0CV96_9CUCU|nr:unnamed protein product [Psylliodes chrysocephala]